MQIKMNLIWNLWFSWYIKYIWVSLSHNIWSAQFKRPAEPNTCIIYKKRSRFYKKKSAYKKRSGPYKKKSANKKSWDYYHIAFLSCQGCFMHTPNMAFRKGSQQQKHSFIGISKPFYDKDKHTDLEKKPIYLRNKACVIVFVAITSEVEKCCLK